MSKTKSSFNNLDTKGYIIIAVAIPTATEIFNWLIKLNEINLDSLSYLRGMY